MFGRRFFRHHHDHHEWFGMRGHGRRGRKGGDDVMGEGGFSFGRGPFGRGPFGGRGGGGGGRVFGPGDTPSPGSVYPTLTLLEELGHVKSEATEGTKRLFEITAAGTRFLKDNEAALS